MIATKTSLMSQYHSNVLIRNTCVALSLGLKNKYISFINVLCNYVTMFIMYSESKQTSSVNSDMYKMLDLTKSKLTAYGLPPQVTMRYCL